MKVNSKFIFVVFATISHMVWLHSAFASPPEGYDFISYQKGIQQSKENDKPMFIYMGRHGCGFCDKTNKESFTNPEVKEKLEAAYTLVYMDSEGGRRITLSSGETMTEMQFAESMNILGTPVFIKMDSKQKIVKKYYGFKTDEELLAMIKN